jgi:hypothetical protein
MTKAVETSLRFVGGTLSVAALGTILAVVAMKAVGSEPMVYSVPGPRPHYQDALRPGLPAHRRPEQRVAGRPTEPPHARFIDVLESQARERSAWVRRPGQDGGGK